jgi:hypothetical protein
MILKLSIFGLVLVLIAVIAIQYYRATEAFQNTRHKKGSKNAKSNGLDACAGVSDDTLIENVPLKCAQQLWLATGCTANGTEYPLNLNSEFYNQMKGETFAKLKKTMTGVKFINTNKIPEAEDPTYKLGCFGTTDSSSSSDACSGIPDNTPSENVPINCIQSQWTKLGCKKDAIGYPIDSDNVISQSAKGMDFGTMKKAVDIFIQENVFSTDDNLRLLCNASMNDITSSDQSAAAPSDRSAAAPERKDIQPEISVSDTSYMAMKGKQKSDLLSSIQKIVRNELLANRVTQPTVRNIQDNNDYDTNDDSHCTAQGSEFKKATPKRMSKGCPDSSDPCDISDQPQNSAPKPYKSNMPDMSKYIKKDSIPCWGCSLDY